MRRLFHHLFTFAAGMSLLLCIAVCVLWALTRNNLTTVEYVRHGDDFNTWRGVDILFARGGAGVRAYRVDEPFHSKIPSGGFHLRRWPADGPPLVSADADAKSVTNRRGFDYDAPVIADGGWYSEVTFAAPIWFVSAVLLVLPSAWTRRARTRRLRRAHGVCVACGYDLRAHTAGDRCPECGTRAPAKGDA